ncbi:MAG: CHRD domain-containing protein [Acidobacteria bacterium]|nr:CHRD domain-containing protein [Acidobacteriota bacterium]
MKRSILAVCAVVAVGCSQQTPVAPADPTAASTAATQARIDNAMGHGGRPLETTLTGAAEVPGPGDPDGTGTARVTLNPGQREICFALTVANIAPATAAHIHEAPAGTAGPVVVGLTAPTSGTSQGCRTVARELIDDILKNPSQYYVNVHNVPYPAGAVRGQLSK